MKEPRRALILAGGGMKVSFQAGVLQVWLDEAGIKFDLADGASGGTLNLAQWCQGRSGTEIADGWRTMRPSRTIQPDLLVVAGTAVRPGALQARSLSHRQPAALGPRLARDPLVRAERDVQRLERLTAAPRGRPAHRNDRGQAGGGHLLADLVPTGPLRWRPLHRLRLRHRREHARRRSHGALTSSGSSGRSASRVAGSRARSTSTSR